MAKSNFKTLKSFHNLPDMKRVLDVLLVSSKSKCSMYKVCTVVGSSLLHSVNGLYENPKSTKHKVWTLDPCMSDLMISLAFSPFISIKLCRVDQVDHVLFSSRYSYLVRRLIVRACVSPDDIIVYYYLCFVKIFTFTIQFAQIFKQLSYFH